MITCMFAIQYHVPFQKNPTTSQTALCIWYESHYNNDLGVILVSAFSFLNLNEEYIDQYYVSYLKKN